MKRLLVVLGIAVFAMPILVASTTRYFAVTMTPLSATASVSTGFLMTIENCPSTASTICNSNVTSATGKQYFGSVQISIPAGFVVDGTSLQVSTTAVNTITGNYKVWTASLSGGSIVLGAGPAAGGNNKIAPGESLTLQFRATPPCAGGNYPWTTSVYQDTLNADGSLNTATPYTAATPQPTVSVTGTCATAVQLTGYCTYSQGGWGSTPHGGNPGTILAGAFPTVYASGLTVGSSNWMKFDSAAAVRAYLPATGAPGVLTALYTDPTSCAACAGTSSGVFGGQVLALRLNLDLESFIPNNQNSISGLKVQATGTSLDGMTVAAIEKAAELALGTPDSGANITTFMTVLDGLNNAFEGCVTSNWANSHLTPQ